MEVKTCRSTQDVSDKLWAMLKIKTHYRGDFCEHDNKKPR